MATPRGTIDPLQTKMGAGTDFELKDSIMTGAVHPRRKSCPIRIFLTGWALCIITIAGHSALAGTISSTWLAENSDDWTDGAQWSTNPNYPNNSSGPSGTSYDATISATGGTAYTVSLTQDITVNSLTINSVDATVNQTSGTFAAGPVNINNGAFLLNGGTIENSVLNLNANSGSFSVSSGTLDSTRVAGGNLVVNSEGALFVKNNLVIDNTNLDLVGLSQVYFDGGSRTIDNLNFITDQGSGNTIYVGGPSSTGSITLTLGSHVTVHDGMSFSNYVAGSTLINNGVLNADSSNAYGVNVGVDNFVNNNIAEATNGSNLSINANNWINRGTISAGANSTVSLGGTWSNAGTISAADSSCQINLGGNFTTAGIGAFNVNDAFVEIAGTLDNSNATLDPGAYGGFWFFNGIAINGGTLNTAAGNFLAANGALNGVHITGGDLKIDYNASLTVANGLTIDNHNLDINNGAQLSFDGPGQTIDNLNITPGGNAYIYSSGPNSVGPQTLTLGSHVTVHDGVSFRSHTVGDALINNGTLMADNNVSVGIDVSVDNFTNSGLAEAINGGTLTIEPTSFTNSGILAVQSATIVAPKGLSLGSGKLIGTGTISGKVTVASGSTLSPGTSTVLGTGASNSIGSLTTGAEVWNSGGKYFWKIARPGTGGVAPRSGGSGTLHGGSGVEGTDWDQIVMSGLTIAAGGSNPSFTIALNSPTPINTASSSYSWIIGRTGSTSLPTFTGASNSYIAGENLLLYSPTGTGNQVVVLDTSAFMINGKTAPLQTAFSLEFEPIASDSGNYDLVLDVSTPAPEPAAGMLILTVFPLLLTRHRRAC